jgi:hypothetical protein
VFLVDPVDLSKLEKAKHSAALALLAPTYVVEQTLKCCISPQQNCNPYLPGKNPSVLPPALR